MISPNPKILILEDEKNLGQTLCEYLSKNWPQTYWANSLNKAESMFEQINPDVALIDLNLPDGYGLDVGEEWRRKKSDLIIFFLSAISDPEIRLKGLEIGGDDYITKPFKMAELTLRLKKTFAHKKFSQELPDELHLGDLKIFFNRYEVESATGEKISLNQKECALLQLLFQKRNHVISRNEIMDLIWGENEYPTPRIVDNYIVKLRKWIDTSNHSNIKIDSIRGVGYKLNAEV